MRKLLAAACLLLLATPAFAQANNGATPYHLVALNTTNSNLIATGQHTVFSVELSGIGAAPAFVKFYDKATAPACNTDAVIKTLIIPVASTAANGAGSNLPFPVGIQVQNGLGICVTGGIADNDNTAVAAASFVVNVDYR